MKRFISTQFVGALALLFSSAGMAASVVVTADNANPAVGGSFSVLVHGDGFPNTTGGGTLGLTWNPAAVSVTSIVLAAGSPFTTIVAASPFNLITVLVPLAGPDAGGSFDAFRINFNANGPGAAQIMLVDDGLDRCWGDSQTFECIPTTYTQANVTVHAPVVPVPAAAWLLVSGLASLAGLKRLRRQ